MLALSVVAPAGQRIREGRKTLEVRRWAPEYPLPLRDLVIVENAIRLGGDRPADDPAGTAVALVDVVRVRPWTEDDFAAASATYFEPGWLAWELANVRPIPPVHPVPACLRLYGVTLTIPGP